ncbi:spermidine/putrescine ABC transporter membrane protein, partial [Metamycoplasma alkalescens]
MNKFKNFLKCSYVFIILAFLYIPIIFGAIYSFNAPSDKGIFSVTTWNRTSFEAYAELFSKSNLLAFANSFLLGLATSILVISLSLLTVFSLW